MNTTSQHLANAVTATSKNTLGAMLNLSAPAQIERPRSIREILDVRDSFVPGYPEHVEQICRVIGEQATR
jgi:hypothetical protein